MLPKMMTDQWITDQTFSCVASRAVHRTQSDIAAWYYDKSGSAGRRNVVAIMVPYGRYVSSRNDWPSTTDVANVCRTD